MKEFRQLTVDDAAEYHEVLIAGYAENKNYPISFDAINFSPEESRAWILKYPVFGLYVDGSLVCSISFRMPWIPKATPDIYPHIAHFVTAPEHKLSLIHISEPTRRTPISYAVFCFGEDFTSIALSLMFRGRHKVSYMWIYVWCSLWNPRHAE